MTEDDLKRLDVIRRIVDAPNQVTMEPGHVRFLLRTVDELRAENTKLLSTRSEHEGREVMKPQPKAGDPCECGKSRLYAFNYEDGHGRQRKELLCAKCSMPHWDNYEELKQTTKRGEHEGE